MNSWKSVSMRRVRRNFLRIIGRESAMPTHPFVQQHRRHLKKNDVFVVSYPRSGNTWMRLLLTDILQPSVRSKTETDLAIGYGDVIPDLDRGYWPATNVEFTKPFRLFKTHSVYHPLIKNALVVIRNPADCLCSYFHFFRRLHPSDKRVRAGIDAFCLRNVDDWCIHVASYLKTSRNRSLRSFWTSYEQLHTQPLQVLQSATAYLGLDTTDAACQKAIESNRFDNLRADDSLGSKFHEYFFRSGQLNSGLNELRADTIDAIELKTSGIHDEAMSRITSIQNRSAA